MKYVVEIPVHIKSQNEFHGRAWFKKADDRREWETIATITVARKVPRATGPRTLSIIAKLRRPVDVTNIVGGAKGLIDALVSLGILIDDRPKFMPGLRDTIYVKCPKEQQPSTVLIFEDVDEGWADQRAKEIIR